MATNNKIKGGQAKKAATKTAKQTAKKPKSKK
jgi:hypothetical protein